MSRFQGLKTGLMEPDVSVNVLLSPSITSISQKNGNYERFRPKLEDSYLVSENTGVRAGFELTNRGVFL